MDRIDASQTAPRTSSVPTRDSASPVTRDPEPGSVMDGEAPRYVQIMDILSERIGSGRYAIGGYLPTEMELCAEFGVSRYTVREALRRLVDRGMVSRRQGAGSEILAAEPQRHYVHKVGSLGDLSRYAFDTHLDIEAIEDVALPEPEAEPLGGRAGERWLLVRSVRRVAKGGEPICVTHSWIPGRFGWLRDEFRETVGPLYGMLEKRTGEIITDAVQRICARPLNRTMALALRREEGDPALCILRRYSSPAGTLVASYNWHPGDSFTYEMGLQLSSRV